MTDRARIIPLSRSLGVTTLAALLGLGMASNAVAQDSHLLVVEGLAGSPDHGVRFAEWSTTLLQAAVERQGLAADHVHYLLPDPATSSWAGADRSSAEVVRATIEKIALGAGPQDLIAIVLIGHGTATGDEARFNLPGPDLTAKEWGDALIPFLTQRVVFVNTASASGGFVASLSRPGRTVITATRTARERNETVFPAHFVAAFSQDGSDIDRDGRVSFYEAFEYARQEVIRDYGERDLLVVEHAVLDDDGDGEGTSEPVPGEGDGVLASSLHLAPAVSADASPELRALLAERAVIESDIAALRGRRDSMDEEVYLAELETLLVRLAEKAAEIQAAGGGSR